MKAVILAGGLGTRISEETYLKPKPMIEIGGKPILWHIMKMYSRYGINDFIICCGYKGHIIKEYFSNYYLHQSDVTFHLSENRVDVLSERSEPWIVTLVNTGEDTMTGTRLSLVAKYLDENESFCMTYGDGVSDINIKKLIRFHHKHGKKATITAVYPPGRFGALNLDREIVTSFKEKPEGDGGMINGGFFVLSASVFELVKGLKCSWEIEPLQSLAKQGELCAYKHDGFWQPMDTLRDKNYLENLWSTQKAPWKTW